MLAHSCIKLIEVSFGREKSVKIHSIKLGEIDLSYDSEKITEQEIVDKFGKLGFNQLTEQNQILTEKIKQAAIELIYLANNVNSLIRNSEYISERVQQPYTKISRVFSATTGITLEKYLILLKIERTKGLLVEGEFTLSEIAYMLGYSSVQYLSNQFKTVTGYTVSQFKKLDTYPRIALEDIF